MVLPSRYGIEKKINSMAGLSAYKNGYDYGDKAKDFTRADYKVIAQDGKKKWGIVYRDSDVLFEKSVSFNNFLEAQRWSKGYNTKLADIESMIPGDNWKKINTVSDEVAKLTTNKLIKK